MCGARERRRTGGRRWGQKCILICLCGILLSSLPALAELSPENVLILVNENSPTSRYIAKLYRQYHSDITDEQVFSLSGLTDCSGSSATAADEIITRGQYEQFIAQPVRDYLSDSNYPERLAQIKVIVTTAGMPYRILDSTDNQEDVADSGNVVYAGGSNPTKVSNNLRFVDAASVESELTCLWYSNYGTEPFGLENRVVNVYQGYRQSSISVFERLLPGSKTMQWTDALSLSGDPPKIEGENGWGFPIIFGATNRSFNAGDIYLTCRLDGPKNQNKSAVFAVRAMLERAKRASNPDFGGVNPAQAVVVIDESPTRLNNIDSGRVYNLDASVNYIVYQSGVDQPPDAKSILIKDDYIETFTALTNEQVESGQLNVGLMEYGGNLAVLLDYRDNTRTTQADLDNYASNTPGRDEYQGIILLATFGYNGDEGSGGDYLLHDGPDGGALFSCVNGAIFTSIESLNAVTMFSDVDTLPAPHHQGKIMDFIEIGGCGAIGHSFEPVVDAIVDNLYLHYNLLADEDGDGFADLSFIEAAYTAIPYLSWSEVVIGDPLMRIAYGEGQKAWTPLGGDANNNGWVLYSDLFLIRNHLGGVLNTTDEAAFEKYCDLCDINQNGVITYRDISDARVNLGQSADW